MTRGLQYGRRGKRGGWARGPALALTLAVLLLNVFAGATLPAGQGPGFAAGLQDEHVQICTSSGMVVLDENGRAIPQAPAGHDGLCVFCLPLLHGGITAPAQLLELIPTAQASSPSYPAPNQSVPPIRRLPGSAEARAPPSPVPAV